jgi:hypothetical protein
MADSPSNPPARAASSQTVYWIIALLLAVIATALWTRPGESWLPPALAQNQALAGARGVYAFAGPLDRDQYGLFMLDVDQGTIWCYALDSTAGANRLRLVAARTWMYDRYLQDFNCAPPDFRMVQKLVSQQRVPAAADGNVPAAATDAPAVTTQPQRPTKH